MSQFEWPDVTADDLFDSAGIGPNGEFARPEGREGSPALTEEEEDTLEAKNYLMVSRGIGILQTKPTDKQQAVFSELSAKYLPQLVEAFRKRRHPNNAPQALINYIAYNPYFVRFSRTPVGADLARIQAQRMAHIDLLPSEDPDQTVAMICQFLSTLFVLYSVDIGFLSSTDERALLRRLKGWRKAYKGTFAEETTGRCIDMLEPTTKAGKEMTMMTMMMKMTLGLGVDMCAIKGCKSGKEEKELMQCSKCRTVRYCGREHQKQDWPNHKSKCYPPSF